MSAPYGTAPLGYQGLKEKNPPNIRFFQRAPTTRDFTIFDLGDIWIDQSVIPDPQVYILVEKAMNIANWIQVTAGSGGVLNQLTASTGADPVVVPTAGNINILQGNGIVTNGLSPTITISTSGIVPTSFPTDNMIATPSGGVLNIVGGAGIITSAPGPGNSVTITASGPSFAWQVDSSSPVAVLVDTGHISQSATITYNLPAVCAVGDEMAFVARDANGFILQADVGQTVRLGSLVTAGARQVASTEIGDTLEILCTVANTEFLTINSVGNFNLT